MRCYDPEGNGVPGCVLSPTLVRQDSSIRRGRDLTGGRNLPLYQLATLGSLGHLLLWGREVGLGRGRGCRSSRTPSPRPGPLPFLKVGRGVSGTQPHHAQWKPLFKNPQDPQQDWVLPERWF